MLSHLVKLGTCRGITSISRRLFQAAAQSSDCFLRSWLRLFSRPRLRLRLPRLRLRRRRLRLRCRSRLRLRCRSRLSLSLPLPPPFPSPFSPPFCGRSGGSGKFSLSISGLAILQIIDDGFAQLSRCFLIFTKISSLSSALFSIISRSFDFASSSKRYLSITFSASDKSGSSSTSPSSSFPTSRVAMALARLQYFRCCSTVFRSLCMRSISFSFFRL
mmetsp:Transcript_6531/g.14130  ORF Transcript_6531/g.14130 Transcript_6531/m.14130 type:complete len:217 (+) Transcript_6531:159-809(+)